jgi:hypothetical protein
MQIENGLAAVADDVDVRRAMIVRVDHDAQASEAEDRRHAASNLIRNLIAWVFLFKGRAEPD